MPTATEIVFLHLKEGSDVEDSGSPAAAQLKKCIGVLSSQPGFDRLYWGLKHEDPQIFVMTIDWNDVEDHKNFINSEAYKPFTGDLAEIFDFEKLAPFFYHVALTSDSVATRQAPVTEFATFSLAADASSNDMSKLEDHLLKLTQRCKEKHGLVAFATGWAMEEQDHAEASGGKAKVLQGLLGWESLEQHMKARESSDFGPYIGPIRDMTLPRLEGRTYSPVFHVKLQGKK